MTSHPSHPLYLCHHNLSTGITLTFVCHHTEYMCDIICTLYNITSTPYVITLLYLWHHNLYIWNHILYVGQHIHYTCEITATSLCHHSHCIDISHPIFVPHHTRHMYDIFCTIHDIRSSFYDIKPPFLGHHTHYMTSYPLYLCHHIHCIDIMPIVFMRSHPLYMMTSYAL